MTLNLVGFPVLLGIFALVHAQTKGALLFQEEFNGDQLNRTTWVPFVTDNPGKGWPWNYVSTQPKNSSAVDVPGGNYLDYDLPSAVRVSNGYLTLNMSKGSPASGFSWTGAVVTSYPSTPFGCKGYTFKNSFVEVRAHLPDTTVGPWPAIWFLPGPGSSGAEIDLHEGGFLDGSIPTDQVFACHLQSTGNVQIYVNTGEKISNDFHTFAVAYKEGTYVKMFLDGKLMCTYTKKIPKGSYFILLNNGMASSATMGWHSQVTSTTSTTNTMIVDYVRVYALA
eukprot:RCo049709